MNSLPTKTLGIPSTLALVAGVIIGAPALAESPRAAPPEFSDDERAIFFPNALEALVGPRPDFLNRADQIAAERSLRFDERGGSHDFLWNPLIEPTTIETEIKRQARVLSSLVQSASSFKGGGYRKCRNALSMVAIMFTLATEHEEDVRWGDLAPRLRGLFGRAAANCKVGTDSSFREAVQRSQDLNDLIRGDRPDTPRPEVESSWGAVADRVPLMRRMETAQQALGPLATNAKSLSRHAEAISHEAQILASLGEILTREGLEDADDEEYVKFSRQLRDSARTLSEAAREDQYEATRQALGNVGKACAACHENYRG